MKNKLMSLGEAVQKYIHDRALLAIGGFALSRQSTSFSKEILRQRKKGNINVNDLTIIESGISFGVSLLVAEGVVDTMICPFSAHERAGLSVIVKDSLERGIPRKIKWEEESNLTLNLKLMAGALNVPFMPSASGLWGDMRTPGLWDGKLPYLKNIVMDDPYGSGRKVALLSALKPDVSIVHVPFADIRGNGIILGSQYYDIWLSRAGKKIILTADYIVDTDMCRQYPNLVTIPGVGVDAVVPSRFGAWPVNCVGVHGEDMEHIKEFIKSSRGEALREYIEKYVYSWETPEDYLALIGKDRCAKLMDDPSCQLALPFKKWIFSQEKISELMTTKV